MADADQSPRSENHVEATTDPCRAYNAPGLSAKRFLLAVMHAKDLPIRDRIKAASALLRIYGEHEFEPPRLRYIIPEFPHSCARAADLGPPTPDLSPDGKNRNQQSFSPSRSNRPHAHDRELGDPKLMETNIEALTFDQIVELI